MPGGTTTTLSPVGVGTVMRAPRSASHTLMGTSQCTLSPLRAKNGCSRDTGADHQDSPRGPPKGPACPSPGTRNWAPESTPAGMFTVIRSVARRTPRPWQSAQRWPSTLPVAPHSPQAEKRVTM